MIAHISEDGKRVQKVKEHLVETAELAGIFLEDVGMSSVGKIAGLVHDMGKYSDLFLEYIKKAASGERVKRGSVNHSLCGAKYLDNEFDDNLKEMIAAAVMCHHGGLIDMVDQTGIDGYHQKYDTRYDIQYNKCIKRFNGEVANYNDMKMMLNNALEEINSIFNEKIRKAYPNRSDTVDGVRLFARGLLEKLIYSALIDADRYNTYCFEIDKKIETAAYEERNKGGTEFWSKIMTRFNQYMSDMKASDSYINRIRSEISDQCLKAAEWEDGIYRLCVPTGGGKTLSSLRYAIEHCRKYNKKRIFYVIPYQSIIDQNAKVISSCIGEENVLEHHSNVITGEESAEELKTYELLTQRWDSPVVLTTMVQFLNTFFKGGTRDIRRMHNLCNSVIIVDEVQALGAECTCLFTQAVNFLKTVCNSTIVLCSATQPDFKNLSMGYGVFLNDKNPDIISNFNEYFNKLKRTRIVDLTDQTMTCEMLGDFVHTVLKENNTILVIMNTKNAALKLYNEVKSENVKTLLLTTKFCKAHRTKILDELEDVESGEKLICISTQLIEAGVDISMDCVIRSKAGLDSLAQAAGRCNRNGEADIKNVYFVSVDFESLKMLPGIANAQKASNTVMRFISKEEKRDLLAPEIMDKYCRAYRNEIGDLKLKYPIDMKSDGYPQMSICDLMITGFGGKRHPLYLKQAFKTVGEKFKVIDAETISVIVPYGEGKKLILDLNGGADLGKKYELLRKASGYTVNIFYHELLRLQEQNGVIWIDSVGVWAVNEGFYDEEIGLKENGNGALIL